MDDPGRRSHAPPAARAAHGGDRRRLGTELASAPPRRAVVDLAGPEPQDLVEMARRTLVARGQALKLIPSWRDGPLGVEMAGEVLLPGPEARIASGTFDAWLESIRAEARPSA